MSYVILGIATMVISVAAAQALRRDPAQMGLPRYGESNQAERIKLSEEGFSFKESLKTNQFWLIFCAVFCLGFCIRNIFVHILPHAIDLGTSTIIAANILAVISATNIAGNVAASSVSDRIGTKITYIISFILTAASFFWLMPVTGVWQLYVFAIVFGFGIGSSTPLSSPLIAKLYGLRSHGLIFGINGLGYTIGAAVGPYLTGYIFDITGSYWLAFLIAAILCIVAIILVALLEPIIKLDGKI